MAAAGKLVFANSAGKKLLSVYRAGYIGKQGTPARTVQCDGQGTEHPGNTGAWQRSAQK